jgi:uncharacterized membrane protein
MPPLTDVMFEHLHNKLVHFPIALSIAAALLLLFGRGRREIERVASALIWGAVIAAMAAYFTGRAQQEPVDRIGSGCSGAGDGHVRRPRRARMRA